MARFARTSLLLAVVGIFAASVALANIPDPSLSDAPENLLISPDAGLLYSVQVAGPLGPVNGADVEIRVGAQADPLVTWCSGQPHPSIFGTTNGSGVADFFIGGGGCVDANRLSTPDVVFQVIADGVEIKRADAANTTLAPGGIVSPDVVNSSGELATEANYVADALAQVTLSDAVFHTGPIVGATLELCSDVELSKKVVNGEAIELGDAVVLTPYIVGAVNCAP